MPRYKITSPDGREVTIEGSRPPTQEDAAKIFTSLPPKKEAPATKGVIDTIPEGAESPATGHAMEGALLGDIGLPANSTTQPLRGGGAIADIAAEGGGATAGQVAGALTGPFAPIAIPVLGGIGGGVGNYLAQKRRISSGEQAGVKTGEVLRSVITSAIPGGALAATGTRALIREGGKQAAGGLLAKNVETAIDEGRLATPTESVLSTVIPAAGGAAAQRIQALNPEIQAAVAAAAPITPQVRSKVSISSSLPAPPRMVMGILTDCRIFSANDKS